MNSLSYFEEHAELFCCPKCGGELSLKLDCIECQRCRKCYQVIDGIPLFLLTNKDESKDESLTDRVKAFYEQNPFPNYNEFENLSSLVQKIRSGTMANMLDEQLPYGIRILECGCGTGQMSILLSLAQRTVFGVDICLNSLKLGESFKRRNNLRRVYFLQMNLFAPAFKPETFHMVISNGVLHHTDDPFLAFQNIAKLVKPGGYILIGMYHKYGRLFNDFRRLVFKMSNNRLQFLDPLLGKMGQAQRESWFADQYQNPHESKHTIGEVLEWFRQTGFTFIKSIPKSALGTTLTTKEKLFTPERTGNTLERFLIEFSLIFKGSREGGFFVMIGRKK
jgi:SAM-dependent methyltransferase